jgi:uncharacterized membrane protein YheB (UPF0754 family)
MSPLVILGWCSLVAVPTTAVSVMLAGVPSLLDLPASFPADLDLTLLLIPPITGIIGYVTNWVGVRMLFHPVEFEGVTVPGMAQFATLLPTKVQQIPGVMQGRLGWQGIVPSRAAKMGSLAVDKGISKVASQGEFYEQFEPSVIATHLVTSARDDVHAIVEEVVREEHPQLWADLPAGVRQSVHDRVDAALPTVVRTVTERVRENVDELLDLKLMVIEHLSANPELLNKIFLEVGDRELRFLVNSGLVLGTLLGFVSIPLYVFVDRWWVLPLSGVFVGYCTNWIAIKAIFNPTEPRQVGSFEVQGLFVKRQDEAAETYARIIAEDVVTLSNVVDNLLHGSQSDRSRRLVADAVRPAVDDAMGMAAPLARLTTGEREYEEIRRSLATEAPAIAESSLSDPAFEAERSAAIQRLIAERMKALPPEDYVEMLRSAFQEDEWLLIGVGAALGFVAGWLQLLVVTAV